MSAGDSGGASHLFAGRERVEEWIALAPDAEAGVYCMRAPGAGGSNEDAAAVLPLAGGAVLLAVADGVGGQPAGEHASARALQALLESVESAAPADAAELQGAVLAGLEQANRAVLDLGGGAATTIAVAEIGEGHVRTYHAGDSAVLVLGGRGKVRLQTIAHSPVGYALEAGVLDESAAMNHDDRHMVSNVLGDPGMHLEMSSRLRMRARDTVIVASDGLFDNLYVEEIAARLRRGGLRRALPALVSECRERMRSPVEGRPSKPDDLTVIAWRRRPSRKPDGASRGRR